MQCIHNKTTFNERTIYMIIIYKNIYLFQFVLPVLVKYSKQLNIYFSLNCSIENLIKNLKLEAKHS